MSILVPVIGLDVMLVCALDIQPFVTDADVSGGETGEGGAQKLSGRGNRESRSSMNQDFNQQQYNDKLAQVSILAVTYANDGTGYHSMKDAFNEL